MTNDRTIRGRTVLLESINPLDVTHEDLDDLANAIEGNDPTIEVDLGYDEQHGSGVTGLEVLHIWLDYGQPILDGVISTAIVEFTKWQHQRRKDPLFQRRGSALTFIDISTGEEREGYLLEPEAIEVKKQDINKDEKRRPPTARHRHRRPKRPAG